MNQIDALKMELILNDTAKKLAFLEKINTQDDLSSELAGYEISKLLKEQTRLEDSYAELVQKRSNLLGITHKIELQQTQVEIKNVAQKLKESTKKLCRLFKENPDLERDAQKVCYERRSFINSLEELRVWVTNGALQKFQHKTTKDLEEQDKLRKFIAREKELNYEIKKLQTERQQEYKDYQNEIQEKNTKIQTSKEKLLFTKNTSIMNKQYQDKECKSKENTQSRIYEYQQKELQAQIKNYQQKINTENLVFNQLKSYLEEKDEKIRAELEEMVKRTDKCRQELEDDIEALTQKKNKAFQELEELRGRKEKEAIAKAQREQQEIEENEHKKQKELEQILLDNAIKLIQSEYQFWKDNGGGKKKGKKGGKKKK